MELLRNLVKSLQQNADKTEEARILQEKYLFCDKNGQVMVPFGDKDTWLSFGGNMYTDELKTAGITQALSVNFPTFIW